MPYDPSLPLILATDASKTGLGAVLSHQLKDGRERPIAYASRTMSSTEQRYPQIDKEALAIVWAVQKFFFYLYARHFTLFTDNKPLSQIMHPEKSLPILCISRMANYADYLAHFNYDIKFKPAKLNANADYCSRAPLPMPAVNNIRPSCVKCGEEEEEFDDFDHFIIRQIQQLPTRAENIARETAKDHHLGRILRLLQSGQDLIRAGYKAPEAEYKLAANCLVFEHRVIVPPKLRQAVLKDLHAAHLGIVKMKGMARSFVYWPGIDADIESIAKSCDDCAKHAHAPPQFHAHHWEYPHGPWERIHIDYAGPFAGKMLLIVSDAYSKWLEVKITSTTTAAATIALLDDLFTSYGAPQTIVSDNGTQFTSTELRDFLRHSGVKYHKFTAPYHPSTNGQAERNVQTVKDHLKIMSTASGSLQRNLNEFLRQYRKAPHSTTGQSPAQLFLGRPLRTRLDLLKPEDLYTKITEKQRANFDPSFRVFYPAQTVYFLSGNPRMDKWIPGTINSKLGDLHYDIVFSGKHFKRHVDQIRGHQESEPLLQPNAESPIPQQNRNIEQPRRQHRFHYYGDGPAVPETTLANAPEVQQPAPPALDTPPRQNAALLDTPRRSTRVRKPPARFSPS